MKKSNFKIIFGLLLFSAILGFSASAQSDWTVSEAKANQINPVKASAESIKEGKALYTINCKSCHGDAGKNNGLPLIPKPTDVSNINFLNINSDGSIFSKITDGKVTMPSFKTVLTENQRWNIVNYVRSLDPNKKQIISKISSKVEGQVLNAPYQISLTYSEEDSRLTAFVEGTNVKGEFAPASDREVDFFINRYFGDLPIGERGGMTNSSGIISADIPTDLPGGEDGKVLAYVQLSDIDTYGIVKTETEVKVMTFHHKNLLEDRSLWTVSAMAPWWLIFTYFGIVIGVWATLGYVVFLLLKIKKAGQK